MRLRVRFAKHGKVRWTSHRDVARMWERAFRRVGLPVAWTGGFSPRPRVSFGLALPTGCESEAEYLDVDLDGELGRDGAHLDPLTLPARLGAALPVGMDVTAVAVLDDKAESLQQVVTCCTWRIELPGVTHDEAAGLVARALAADTLVVTRERKGHLVTDDLRPAIRALHVVASGPAGTELEAELATQPRGVRPGELLLALGLPPTGGRIRRLYQWIERDGARWEPLPPAVPAAPHAEARAS